MIYIIFLFPIISILVYSSYILHNNTNHGTDFLFLVWPLSACAAIALCKIIWPPPKSKYTSAVLLKINTKHLMYAALIMNILAILFVYSVDYFNIMLDYNEWIRRGMPDSFGKTNFR